MKKEAKPLDPNSFEAMCSQWEQRLMQFVTQLSDGSIPTLRNAQWTVQKKRVFVAAPDPEGRKKRGALGPSVHTSAALNPTAADAVWRRFKVYAKDHGLTGIERLRNNEKELGWYDFRAADGGTGDSLSCQIDLPGKWRKTGIHIKITVAPRYRNEDLQDRN